MDSNKVQLKRIIREYEFLLEDLEDIKNMRAEINTEFIKSLQDIDSDGVLDSAGFEKAAIEWSNAQKEEQNIEEPERDPVFKKLFRSIVVKCHPDKLRDLNGTDTEFYTNMYNAAVESNETDNWALLIRTAIKLEVDIPEEAYSMLDRIKEDLEALKIKQASITSTPAWRWYHMDQDANKSDMLKNHLDFLKTFNK